MSTVPGEPTTRWGRLRSDLRAQLAGLLIAGDVRRNAMAVFAIRVLSAGLLFLSQIVLARWIGAAHYGTYVALWSMVLVLGGLSHFGLGVAMMRLVPEYLASHQYDLARGILTSGRLLAFGGGLLCAVLGSVIVKWLMPGLPLETVAAITMALACVPMFALTEAQDGIGRGQSWTLAGVTPPYVLRPLLVLIFAGVAYAQGLPATAVTAIGAAALATAVTAVAQTLLIGRRIAAAVPKGATAYEFKDWFRVSLPLLIYTSAELVLQNADVLILSFLRSPDEVGVYYAAAKTTTLALFVHYAIGSAYAGRFAEANAVNDPQELKRLARESVVWTFWPSVAVTVAVLAAGPFLLALFGSGFESAYPAMFILSVGLLIRAATGPSEFVLGMLGYEKDCARSYIIAAIVAIVLNFAFVPWFGALGAASASALAFATAAILNWRTAKRKLGINLFVFAREHGVGSEPGPRPGRGPGGGPGTGIRHSSLALVAHQDCAPSPTIGGAAALTSDGAAVSLLNADAFVENAALALDFTIVRDVAGFAALEDDWTALYTRAGTEPQVFLSYEWNRRWVDTYHSSIADKFGVELAIVVGRRNGHVILIWPLLKQQSMGLTYVSCLGQPVTQYCDVLIGAGVRSDEALRAAWQKVRSELKPDVVALRKVRADAALTPLLNEIGGQTTLSTEAPFVDLGQAASFATFETIYSAKARKNRRRLRRRLDEHGRVAFMHLAGGEEASRLARRAIAMKRAWILQRGLISTTIHDPRLETFFADAAAVDGTCCVSALTLNNEPIAIMISVVGRSRLVGHVFAYDVDYEKSGAGVLLLEECLRHAIDNHVTTFDLLAPADAYKFDWSQGAEEVHDWAVPLSLRGRLYTRFYLIGAREPMKRLAAKLPGPWRQSLSIKLADVSTP
jgi:O-antigen/teichoic acid export membrane protein/CelD/BcsL family acetyltransferase involved in cellulose biosynthesis